MSKYIDDEAPNSFEFGEELPVHNFHWPGSTAAVSPWYILSILNDSISFPAAKLAAEGVSERAELYTRAAYPKWIERPDSAPITSAPEFGPLIHINPTVRETNGT